MRDRARQKHNFVLKSEDLVQIGLDLANHEVDFVRPGVEAQAHHANLLQVENTRLYPADEDLAVDLIDGALDEAERESAHHEKLNLLNTCFKYMFVFICQKHNA